MYQYFLLNYGQGYTGEFIGSMSFDELAWHVSKRHDDLMEQKKQHDKQLAAAKAKARTPRRR